MRRSGWRRHTACTSTRGCATGSPASCCRTRTPSRSWRDTSRTWAPRVSLDRRRARRVGAARLERLRPRRLNAAGRDYAGNPIRRDQARRAFDDYVNALGASWLSYQVTPGQHLVSGLFVNDGESTLHRISAPTTRATPTPCSRSPTGSEPAQCERLRGHRRARLAREFSIYLVRNQFASDRGWTAHGPLAHRRFSEAANGSWSR